MNALKPVMSEQHRNMISNSGLIFLPGAPLRVGIQTVCFFLGIKKKKQTPKPTNIFSPFTGTSTDLFQIPVLGEACSHQVSPYPLSTLGLEPCFYTSQATSPGPSAACTFAESGVKGWIKLSNINLANKVLHQKKCVGSNSFN